ncbi:hypothetical protein PVAND_015531 [Polypedilum vanderplanki]|uniref:Serpin domain-containing protein n=1 Tax=Polypedilum vanderplanki TaxID=319348 RepID=A0A9J6BD96_POLVA|nr:hypothetical protein PVAND_015531 [Polypedilum vanderplanki]
MECFKEFLIIYAAVFHSIHFVKTQDVGFLNAQQKFALELFSTISGPDHSTDVILSPISVSTALSILLIGSNGVTFKQLFFGLQYPTNYSINLVQVNSNLMIKNMAKVGAIEFATKLFITKSFSLQNNFKTSIDKYFQSGVESVDFSQNVKAAQRINDYISTSTHGMIQDVIKSDDLTEYTTMILVNCIFFKGLWQFPFDKSYTFKSDFNIDNKNTIQVDYMYQENSFNFGYINALNDAQVLELPYANSKLTLTLILPQTIDGIKNLVKAAKNFDFTKLSNQLTNTSVIVSIPKFNTTFEQYLNSPLTNMGMPLLFNKTVSQLDHIAHEFTVPKSLALDGLYHKAVIIVNEEGTTAAAVSVASSFSIKPTFTADRPFLYALRTNSNIYFLGLYAGNPQ